MPCKLNHYCIDGLRYQCPSTAPVTQGTGAGALNECLTCVQRNGNESNPIYDDLVGDCVSCYEYDSSTPVWDGSSCVACADDESYDTASGTCIASLERLTEQVGTCEIGYIKITTARQLAQIGKSSDYTLDDNYCLMNDISLSDYNAEINNGEGWQAIGLTKPCDYNEELQEWEYNTYETEAFNGIFDGNGYKISDLYINTSSHPAALFYEIADSATIRNLAVENIDISGCEFGTAGLAVTNYGNIENCQVNGSINSDYFASGFVDENYGTITESSAISDIMAGEMGAGFARRNYGEIYACYSAGTLTSGASGIGGFVATNEGAISACHSSVIVTCYANCGGFVCKNNANIQNSYSTGDVIAVLTSQEAEDLGYEVYIGASGGFAVVSTLINNCYSAGVLSGELIGGFANIGIDIENSYFDRTKSGVETACYFVDEEQGYNCGATAKTTEEMQTPQTFIDAGWDETIWELVEGQYPKLKGVGGQD